MSKPPRKPSPRRVQAVVKAATNGAIEAVQARLSNSGGFWRASITIDLDGCCTQIAVESGGTPQDSAPVAQEVDEWDTTLKKLGK